MFVAFDGMPLHSCKTHSSLLASLHPLHRAELCAGTAQYSAVSAQRRRCRPASRRTLEQGRNTYFCACRNSPRLRAGTIRTAGKNANAVPAGAVVQARNAEAMQAHEPTRRGTPPDAGERRRPLQRRRHRFRQQLSFPMSHFSPVCLVIPLHLWQLVGTGPGTGKRRAILLQ